MEGLSVPTAAVKMTAADIRITIGSCQVAGYSTQSLPLGRSRVEGREGLARLGAPEGLRGLSRGSKAAGGDEVPAVGSWGLANRHMTGRKGDCMKFKSMPTIRCHVEGSAKSLIYGEYGWEKIAVRRLKGPQPNAGKEPQEKEASPGALAASGGSVEEAALASPSVLAGRSPAGEMPGATSGSQGGEGDRTHTSRISATCVQAAECTCSEASPRPFADATSADLHAQEGETALPADLGSEGIAQEWERRAGPNDARELSSGHLYARHPVSRPQTILELEEFLQQGVAKGQRDEGSKGDSGASARGEGSLQRGWQSSSPKSIVGEESRGQGAGPDGDWHRVEPIQARVVFLETTGMDVANAISAYPLLMSFPLAELEAKVAFLERRGVTSEQLGRVLTVSPEIFGKDVETELLPTAKFVMERVGVRKKHLGKVIARYPRLLLCSVEQLQERLQFLASIGIENIGKAATNNPALLAGSIEEKLVPKIRYFESLGISYDDAIVMFRRFPSLFCYGLETNIRPKVEYLQNVMKKDVREIVSYPQYFGCSFEGKIKPRYEYLCRAKHVKISLLSMLALADELFYERFSTGTGAKGESFRKSRALMRQKAIVNQRVASL